MADHGSLGTTSSRRELLKRSSLVGMGLIGASGIGATLAGCGSSDSGSSSGVTTITLAISGTSAVAKKNWSATFAEFNKANPKIKIKGLFVKANGWVDFFSALQTQIAGGTAVDAIYIPTEGMQLFAKRGLINPLDDYVAKNKGYIDALYKDIDESMLKGFKAHSNPDGKTYYVPYAYNTTCIA